MVVSRWPGFIHLTTTTIVVCCWVPSISKKKIIKSSEEEPQFPLHFLIWPTQRLNWAADWKAWWALSGAVALESSLKWSALTAEVLDYQARQEFCHKIGAWRRLGVRWWSSRETHDLIRANKKNWIQCVLYTRPKHSEVTCVVPHCMRFAGLGQADCYWLLVSTKASLAVLWAVCLATGSTLFHDCTQKRVSLLAALPLRGRRSCYPCPDQWHQPAHRVLQSFLTAYTLHG